MKIRRYIKSYLFYIVTALLAVSIGVSSFAFVSISKKNEEIKNAQAQIQTANEQLEETKQQLSEEKEANDKISKELKKAKQVQKKLEKQNKAYKKEIEKLNAQNKAEVQTTTQKTQKTEQKPSSQPKYPKATKVCYLTFDDGPSDNTLKILKILKNYNVKATFFVIGTNSKLEYLPKIKNAGHAIGLHSNTHEYSKIYKSSKAFYTDLNNLSKKIEKRIGEEIRIMRFPGGSNNTVSANYCEGIMTRLTASVENKGYTYFDWNVDSGDASGNNVPKNRIVNNVLNQAKNKNSICVLMHDTGAKDTTVKALPEIIEGLKKQGYYFEVLTEKSYGYHYKVNN